MKKNDIKERNKNNSNVGTYACTKKQLNQKAITLIALIITIIVMLILVAVTITLAINGGLFDKAKKASDDTENAKSAELSIADGSIIDYYVNGGTTENIEVSNSEQNLVVRIKIFIQL